MKFTLDMGRKEDKANRTEIQGNYVVRYDADGYAMSATRFEPGVVDGPKDPRFDANGMERFGSITTEKE